MTGPAKSLLGICIAIAAFGGYMAITDTQKDEAKKIMKDVEDDVAKDAVQQYWMAKRNGQKMDACVQAGFVSAAFLQAKKEAEYAQWKRIESVDCAAAGVPR